MPDKLPATWPPTFGLTVQNIWSPTGDFLAERRSPDMQQRCFVLQDPLGNVNTVLQSSMPNDSTPPPASVWERFAYTPYGTPTFIGANWFPSLLSNSGMNFLFQGGRYDANTGLYLFGRRDLNPSLGRWMQTDPLGFGGGDLNLYRFAGNNPINNNDPNGTVVPVIGLAILAFELYGLYTANQAVNQYNEVSQINALPLDQYTPELIARQNELMRAAAWNGAIANVAMVTAGAYSIGFATPVAFTALSSLAPTTTGLVGLALGGYGLFALGQSVYQTVANWENMNGPDRFQSVGSIVGGFFGGTAGFRSGTGFVMRLGGQNGLAVPGMTRGNLSFANGLERVELSHWIPRRWLPQWLQNARWNLKPMWGTDHALNDPFRYAFMPRWWRDANQMNPWAVQQWYRAPYWVHGASSAGFSMQWVGLGTGNRTN